MRYIQEDGVLREMTPEEEADYERIAQEIEQEELNREPTVEERIQQLEDALVEIASLL